MSHLIDLNIIIMAGGLGKRMESPLPKVLHLIAGRPMLVRVIEESIKLSPKKIIIVVGIYGEIIKQTISQYLDINMYPICFVLQQEPLGTGHAIQCCLDELIYGDATNTLILSGDVPLLKASTMREITYDTKAVKITVTNLDNPFGYGRIITDANGIFVKITEENDCLPSEKNIKTVNCGIYSIKTDILCKYLPYLTNVNSQKEYYLTDIIEIIKDYEKIEVQMCNISREKQNEIMGVNTKDQLIELERNIL